MDEADDALVGAEPEQREDRGIVGRPACQPGGAEAEPLRRLQEGEAGATGAEQAFLFGDRRVGRVEHRHHDHHLRRMREAGAVLGDGGVAGVWMQFQAARGDRLAKRVARMAGDGQEAERDSLAVVGHANGRGQHALQLVRARPGLAQLSGRNRAARVQGVQERELRAICDCSHSVDISVQE